MITLAIAEDHQALIDGMKLLFKEEADIMIVGEANDGETLIELVKNKKPSVVITDIRMPKCDGITATKIIKEKYPSTKVIAFSMFDQEEAIEQMKAAGASGYIMKNSSLQTLLNAIRSIAKNETFYDNAITSKDETSKETIILSRREKEILRLIGDGKSSHEIADILNIGKTTVDTHRKNLMKKINIKGRTELIRFAVERKYDF
ncbi:MAG TPA: response regulator transcription factor [Flavobacterium sp.]|uniref:response regulator transcription factor n=1 Tax=Flavobacterium sp. TaxID=239 RepID=UPI002BFCF2EE|nr:response regulator transcription factor [Flavobacterium sp.]HNP32591.1 response regulator transcription factor [Flavobacterium sp.]